MELMFIVSICFMFYVLYRANKSVDRLKEYVDNINTVVLDEVHKVLDSNSKSIE